MSSQLRVRQRNHGNGVAGGRRRPITQLFRAVTPPNQVLQPIPSAVTATVPQNTRECVENGRKRYAVLPLKVRYTIKALAQWAGWKLTRIAAALEEPYSTVHGVVHEAITPQMDRAKRSLKKFGTPVANRIIAFVTRDENGRRATYNQIKTALELECSESTIRRRLQESGYHRLVARYAPWLDEENMDLRGQFGEWCLTQMPKPFIFGDAVAFGRGGTQQQRVTRRPGKYCSGRICDCRRRESPNNQSCR